MKKIYSKEVIQRVNELRPIDDAFFRLLAKDKGTCQEIINTLTDDNFEVLSVTPQNAETSAFKEVILDALCRTSTGSLVNIEVQKGNSNNDVKRCRFHAATITANHTEKGSDFENIPDVIVLYITEYDALGNNQTVTVCETCALTGNDYNPINDGLKIFYANTEVKDNSNKSELLQLFLQKKATENINFPNLCRRMKYYKENRKGLEDMCKVVEEYAEKCVEKSRIEELIKTGIAFGVSKDKIINRLQEHLNLSKDDAMEKYELYK